jgi:hypothetical protein
MCGPLAIGLAAGAASLAGSVMTSQTAKNAQNAQAAQEQQQAIRRKQLRDAETQRQDAFRAENQAQFDKTIKEQGAESQTAELEKQQSQRAAEAQPFIDNVANADPTKVALQGTNTGNDMVRTEMARRLAMAASESRKRVAALSNMGGYEGLARDNARKLGQGTEQMNLVNDMRKGSLGAMDVETNLPAVKVQPGSNILGQALTGLGSMLGKTGGFG